jgi:gas vesicle protein
MNKPMPEQKKSHFGAGLIAGAMMGVAAGLFLQSQKGKQMTKVMQKKAFKLQIKLMKELKNAKSLSKDKYEEIVDSVMDYYVKSKEVAKAEVPAIRSYLLNSWTRISKELKSLQK